MKAVGINAHYRRCHAPGQLDASVHATVPNLLDGQFESTGPNQKCAADFAHVWTGKEWLFVAVVLDLYLQRLVGWLMRPTMTAQLAIEASLTAIRRRDHLALCCITLVQVHNTPAKTFSACSSCTPSCGARVAAATAGTTGAEGFFSTLETERLSRNHYRTKDDLRADVFDYIERFYNPRPRNFTMGYIGPVQLEI